MATQSKKKPAAKAKATAAKTPKASPKTTIKPVEGPSFEAIAERAWCIWMDNGCQPGQEEQNWFEAVSQLKTELVSC